MAFQQQAQSEDEQQQYLQPLAQPDTHFSDSDINLTAFKETPERQSVDLRWQPSYLRRLVLVGFSILFALIIVALEILEAVSLKYYGLATSYPALHYLWTYGPTVVLTVVASFWYRVEFQTKMIMPWVHMFNRSDTASKSLLQDYGSSSPISLFRHVIRNRDWAVFTTMVVSLVIKILIILSTGLITLSPTQVAVDGATITLQDTFVDNDFKLQYSDQSLSFYSMQGLLRKDIGALAGITPEFAYQEINATSAILESAAQVQATVVGLTNSFDCEPADLSLIYAVPPMLFETGEYETNMTVTSPSCSAVFEINGPGWNETYEGSNSSLTYFTRLTTSQCDGTFDDSGKRLLMLFGLMNYTLDYSRNYSDHSGRQLPTPFGSLVQSTQLLCVPTYRLTEVDVVQNGTQTLSLTETAGPANWTLKTVRPWQLMQSHLDSYHNSIVSMTSSVSTINVNISGSQQLDVDVYTNVSVTMNVPSYTAVEQFYDPGFLQNFTTRYYQQYAAIIAKQTLMSTNVTANGTAPLSVTGSYISYENRLIVRVWSAQLMAGLLTICVVLSLATIFILPGHSVVPRNPSSLHGIAALFSNSWALIEDLQDAGGGEERILNENLKSSRFSSGVFKGYGADSEAPTQFIIKRRAEDNFEDSSTQKLPQTEAKNTRPAMLRPSTHIVIVFTTVALIVALEVTLLTSKTKGCLGYVTNDTYIHYAWTAVPALVFAALTMAFSAFDFAIRSVIPFMRLKRQVSVDEFMNLEFLDCSVVRAIHRQVRLRQFPALAATTSLLIASLFTIFSSSLFQAVPQPFTTPVSLQAINSFSSSLNTQSYISGSDPSSIPEEVASFILQGLDNTYPPWTWEGMVFPEFNLTKPWPSGVISLDSSQYKLETVIPAIRSHMMCHIYDSPAIQYNLSVGFIGDAGFSSVNMTNTLGVIIDGEGCQLDRSKAIPAFIGYNAFLSTQNDGYFGFGEATQAATMSQGCSELLYVWGHVNYNVTPQVTFISAMGCNQTFETVDVQTIFKGNNFTMSANSPPVPQEATRRNTSAWPIDLSLIYSYLAQVPADDVADQFDQFFSLLIASSKNDLRSSALGTADQVPAVATAIQQQHGIILAQIASNNRFSANATNATLPLGITGKTDADFTYSGNLTDPLGGGRGLCVLQDAASTHILAALLGTALLLFVLSLIWMPNTAVMPRRAPLSIASTVALIAGGNLLSFLPPNADFCSDEEIRQALGRSGEVRVGLGWGNLADMEGRMAGQENEGGASRFGIFVVAPEVIEEAKSKKYKKAR